MIEEYHPRIDDHRLAFDDIKRSLATRGSIVRRKSSGDEGTVYTSASGHAFRQNCRMLRSRYYLLAFLFMHASDEPNHSNATTQHLSVLLGEASCLRIAFPDIVSGREDRFAR
jgi:hypothetical protein